MTTFQTDGDLIRFETTRFKMGDMHAAVAGPRYGFTLKRPSADRQYSLGGLSKAPPVATLKTLRTWHRGFEGIEFPHQLSRTDLGEIIRDPSFVCKDVDNHREADDELVRVKFDYRPKAPLAPMLDGVLLLDPKINWAVRKASFHIRDDLFAEVENTYTKDAQGEFAPARSREDLRYNGGKALFSQSWTLDSIRHDTSPESAFLLSAFGLPEPTEAVVGSQDNHLNYWFFGVAFFLLAAAMTIRWRASRAA